MAIIGLPVRVGNHLFNCGAVIQQGRILGAVPKTYIPCHDGFSEGRWFASGTRAVKDRVMLCGQEVPFGTDLLFEAKDRPDVCFGIEICEDLWMPIPPSTYQSLAGAVMIFNLSACDEMVGRHQYRLDLMRLQSVRCIAGYVFASSGVHESTTDMVFGGHAAIAEYGKILAQSERFKSEGQLIFTELDIQKLLNERRKNAGLMETIPSREFRKVAFSLGSREIRKLSRKISPHPFVPEDAEKRHERCREIFNIQVNGLAKRLRHTGSKRAVIAVSGGLDSTLALLVTAKTFDILGLPRENIYAVTMPGFGTTERTYNNAISLMKAMKTTIDEIDIKPACLQHFKDIGHDPSVHNVTYENVQARERFQILFDIANKIGGLVIGTGDLSELALGWCTFNGDHMSNYSVNCGVPKTLIRFMVRWAADNEVDVKTREVLYSILNTPISPELLPPSATGEIDQRTEDIVGPYELHDFFLYHMIRYGAQPGKVLFLAQQAFEGVYSREVIKKWLKVFCERFFSQQFKRSCLPDGPKVGTVTLSPRGGWVMPSDASSATWMNQIEEE